MIEAMKQWLEALEDFVDVIKYDNEQDDIGRRACCDVLSYNPHSESCKAKQAITAIKEAIREHAMYEVQRLGQEIEQEPVAWMKPDVLCDRACMYLCTKGFTQFPECANVPPQLEQNFCSRCGKRTNDIHTCTPPQQAQKQEPIKIDGNTSDGYHTFNELYEFRKAYNVALFNEWASGGKCSVHKSWRHHDGELCFGGGWFIVVAVLPQGQISNHYEAKDWNLFAIPEVERALFEFDGHTGNDVIERLEAYTTPQPQRTWVGLTDEEIEDIVEDCDGVGWDVAQAIRAKLKEKNT